MIDPKKLTINQLKVGIKSIKKDPNGAKSLLDGLLQLNDNQLKGLYKEFGKPASKSTLEQVIKGGHDTGGGGSGGKNDFYQRCARVPAGHGTKDHPAGSCISGTGGSGGGNTGVNLPEAGKPQGVISELASMSADAGGIGAACEKLNQYPGSVLTSVANLLHDTGPADPKVVESLKAKFAGGQKEALEKEPEEELEEGEEEQALEEGKVDPGKFVEENIDDLKELLGDLPVGLKDIRKYLSENQDFIESLIAGKFGDLDQTDIKRVFGALSKSVMDERDERNKEIDQKEGEIPGKIENVGKLPDPNFDVKDLDAHPDLKNTYDEIVHTASQGELGKLEDIQVPETEDRKIGDSVDSYKEQLQNHLKTTYDNQKSSNPKEAAPQAAPTPPGAQPTPAAQTPTTTLTPAPTAPQTQTGVTTPQPAPAAPTPTPANPVEIATKSAQNNLWNRIVRMMGEDQIGPDAKTKNVKEYLDKKKAFVSALVENHLKKQGVPENEISNHLPGVLKSVQDHLIKQESRHTVGVTPTVDVKIKGPIDGNHTTENGGNFPERPKNIGSAVGGWKGNDDIMDQMEAAVLGTHFKPNHSDRADVDYTNIPAEERLKLLKKMNPWNSVLNNVPDEYAPKGTKPGYKQQLIAEMERQIKEQGGQTPEEEPTKPTPPTEPTVGLPPIPTEDQEEEAVEPEPVKTSTPTGTKEPTVEPNAITPPTEPTDTAVGDHTEEPEVAVEEPTAEEKPPLDKSQEDKSEPEKAEDKPVEAIPLPPEQKAKIEDYAKRVSEVSPTGKDLDLKKLAEALKGSEEDQKIPGFLEAVLARAKDLIKPDGVKSPTEAETEEPVSEQEEEVDQTPYTPPDISHFYEEKTTKELGDSAGLDPLDFDEGYKYASDVIDKLEDKGLIKGQKDKSEKHKQALVEWRDSELHPVWRDEVGLKNHAKEVLQVVNSKDISEIRESVIEDPTISDFSSQTAETNEYLEKSVREVDNLMHKFREEQNNTPGIMGIARMSWYGLKASRLLDNIQNLRVAIRESKEKKEAIDALQSILKPKDPIKFEVKSSNLPPGLNKRVETATDFIKSILGRGSYGIDSFEVNVISDNKVGRPKYNSGKNLITLTSRTSVSTVIHEFGHAIEENVPGIFEACAAFWKHRCGNEKPVDLGDFNPEMSGEFGYRDKFSKVLSIISKDLGAESVYAGKIYDEGGTEILSIGLQALYADPIGFAEKDREYFDFVIATIYGKFNTTKEKQEVVPLKEETSGPPAPENKIPEEPAKPEPVSPPTNQLEPPIQTQVEPVVDETPKGEKTPEGPPKVINLDEWEEFLTPDQKKQALGFAKDIVEQGKDPYLEDRKNNPEDEEFWDYVDEQVARLKKEKEENKTTEVSTEEPEKEQSQGEANGNVGEGQEDKPEIIEENKEPELILPKINAERLGKENSKEAELLRNIAGDQTKSAQERFNDLHEFKPVSMGVRKYRDKLLAVVASQGLEGQEKYSINDIDEKDKKIDPQTFPLFFNQKDLTPDQAQHLGKIREVAGKGDLKALHNDENWGSLLNFKNINSWRSQLENDVLIELLSRARAKKGLEPLDLTKAVQNLGGRKKVAKETKKKVESVGKIGDFTVITPKNAPQSNANPVILTAKRDEFGHENSKGRKPFPLDNKKEQDRHDVAADKIKKETPQVYEDLIHYTDEGSDDLNGSLRGNKEGEMYDRAKKLGDSLVENSPQLQQGTKLTRRLSSKGDLTYDNLKASAGKVIYDPGFLSMSINERPTGTGTIKFETTTALGAKGLYLGNGLSAVPKEGEVLFPPGQGIYIQSVKESEENGKKILLVKGIVMPTDAKQLPWKEEAKVSAQPTKPAEDKTKKNKKSASEEEKVWPEAKTDEEKQAASARTVDSFSTKLQGIIEKLVENEGKSGESKFDTLEGWWNSDWTKLRMMSIVKRDLIRNGIPNPTTEQIVEAINNGRKKLKNPEMVGALKIPKEVASEVEDDNEGEAPGTLKVGATSNQGTPLPRKPTFKAEGSKDKNSAIADKLEELAVNGDIEGLNSYKFDPKDAAALKTFRKDLVRELINGEEGKSYLAQINADLDKFIENGDIAGLESVEVPAKSDEMRKKFGAIRELALKEEEKLDAQFDELDKKKLAQFKKDKMSNRVYGYAEGLLEMKDRIDNLFASKNDENREDLLHRISRNKDNPQVVRDYAKEVLEKIKSGEEPEEKKKEPKVGKKKPANNLPKKEEEEAVVENPKKEDKSPTISPELVKARGDTGEKLLKRLKKDVQNDAGIDTEGFSQDDFDEKMYDRLKNDPKEYKRIIEGVLDKNESTNNRIGKEREEDVNAILEQLTAALASKIGAAGEEPGTIPNRLTPPTGPADIKYPDRKKMEEFLLTTGFDQPDLDEMDDKELKENWLVRQPTEEKPTVDKMVEFLKSRGYSQNDLDNMTSLELHNNWKKEKEEEESRASKPKEEKVTYQKGRKLNLDKVFGEEVTSLTEEEVEDLGKLFSRFKNGYVLFDKPDAFSHDVVKNKDEVKRLREAGILKPMYKDHLDGGHELTDLGAAKLALHYAGSGELEDPTTEKDIEDLISVFGLSRASGKIKLLEHFGMDPAYDIKEFQDKLKEVAYSAHNPEHIADRIHKNGEVTEMVGKFQNLDINVDDEVKHLKEIADEIKKSAGLLDWQMFSIELDKLQDEFNAAGPRKKVKVQEKIDAMKKARDDWDEVNSDKVRIRNEAYAKKQQAVSDLLRSRVKDGEEQKIYVSMASDALVPVKSQQTLQSGANLLVGSVKKGLGNPPSVKAYKDGGNTRPHYRDDGSINFWSDTATVEVAIHEIIHGIEMHNPDIAAIVQEFRRYRVGDEVGTNMGKTFGGQYKGNEIGFRDDFEKAFGKGTASAYYVGKRYDDRTTEILTMGVQKLYEDPSGFAKNDPEYCSFILGVLDGSFRAKPIPKFPLSTKAPPKKEEEDEDLIDLTKEPQAKSFRKRQIPNRLKSLVGSRR